MATLGNFQTTNEIVRKHNFTIQKKFGQNFLIDEHVLSKIVSAAELEKDDYVIEVGPGIGTLTQYLCENSKFVSAVEIDKELIPILNETLSSYDNYEIINEDVLKVDLLSLVNKHSEGKPCKVVANLPYYITTPIIMALLESKMPIESITVMVQKEVAERMMVGPGTKDYGALSLAVQYYAVPYIVANVPQNCFMPRPNVDSAVIRLTCHKKPPVSVNNESLMFDLIRASFNQRRKTLVNGIANFDKLSYTKDQVAKALVAIGLSETVRGETLDLAKFAELSNALENV